VALDKHPEVSAGELAKSADLHPANVTTMLDQLEANGIVERRRRGAHDRRICLVSLTDTGRGILQRRRLHTQALWQQHLGPLSEEALGATYRVIRIMTELLNDL
jgi:DNA-binding MarR family transcriptional regulator